MLRNIKSRSFSRLPQTGIFSIPQIKNEPMYAYEPGSVRRQKLQNAVNELKTRIANEPYEVPCVVGGKHIVSNLKTQSLPTEHSKTLCTYSNATPEIVQNVPLLTRLLPMRSK
jgi:1-pyrroline-5-carboxylate dehydrogenase